MLCCGGPDKTYTCCFDIPRLSVADLMVEGLPHHNVVARPAIPTALSSTARTSARLILSLTLEIRAYLRRTMAAMTNPAKNQVMIKSAIPTSV